MIYHVHNYIQVLFYHFFVTQGKLKEWHLFLKQLCFGDQYPEIYNIFILLGI